MSQQEDLNECRVCLGIPAVAVGVLVIGSTDDGGLQVKVQTDVACLPHEHEAWESLRAELAAAVGEPEWWEFEQVALDDRLSWMRDALNWVHAQMADDPDPTERGAEPIAEQK